MRSPAPRYDRMVQFLGLVEHLGIIPEAGHNPEAETTIYKRQATGWKNAGAKKKSMVPRGNYTLVDHKIDLEIAIQQNRYYEALSLYLFLKSRLGL